MFELKVLSHFAAAHKLQMVAKKCENLHGHNWKIESSVVGEKLNGAGVLIDFGELKKHIAEIMEKLDHKYLNDLNLFNDNIPSSENIAVYIAEELEKCFDGTSIRVSKIKVWESDNACATYTL
jgi:6-pyruvoyltetrahydropterin/6-carboxytetrahydropterin synthase